MTWTQRLLTAVLLSFLTGVAVQPLARLLTTPSTASTPNPSPLFKKGDCLARIGAEKWDAEVWAEVLEVGKANYLLDFRPYKRRSKFADIAAYPLDFELVEHTAEKIACPKRVWLEEGKPHENKGAWADWAAR